MWSSSWDFTCEMPHQLRRMGCISCFLSNIWVCLFLFPLHEWGNVDESYTNGTSKASTDQAFRNVNKNATAFHIWRVENMSITAVPKDQHGTFYDTDSYIVYAASQYGQPTGVDTVPRDIRGSFPEYHIHFWIGSSSTPEKSGVAAYKTVELDNSLNGLATQHRETQGNESPRFKSYFKNGFSVLKSNSEVVISGSKLFKLKGKRNPVLTQLGKISWEYFNSGEIFLIQTPRVLFVWIGRSANNAEKLHASKVAAEMKEHHDIHSVVFVDDGYEKTLPENEKKEFNKYLSLDARHVMPEGKIDCITSTKSSLRLYKCSENNGKYRVAEVKSGPLYQCDLDSDDVYVVDYEINGIWVWVGKRVGEKERSEALRNARGFVKKKKYPNNTRVTRVVEGAEPVEFKMLFTTWKDEPKPGLKAKPTILVSKFDAISMQDRPSLAAETQLIDDGSGTVTLWRINQPNILEIPKERHGIFFSGDCYIVLYTYQTTNEQKHLLYYWLGSHASQEDIDCAATKTAEIDDEFGHLGFQARVIQGQEPAHFLQIFKGKLVIFRGSGTDYDESGRNLRHPSQYLVQTFGATHYSSKAVQVQPRTSSLNSNYCFVLRRGKHSHIWCGNYSTGDQREMAKGFAGKDFELVLEGKEKEEFFNLLGGRAVYAIRIIARDNDPRPSRLFHCSYGSGVLKSSEIFFFTQNDLIPEDIMYLDAYHTLYIWIGKLSTKEDQRQCFEAALEFLQNDPTGRDMNIPIIQIKQGCEPPTFIGFFPSWNRKLWKGYKSFGKMRQDIEGKHKPTSNGEHKNGYSHKKSGHSGFDQYDKYPINILKEPNEKLPARVDPLNKELHLTHDDFVSVFKMSYAEFEKLPRWKQQEMKKCTGLF